MAKKNEIAFECASCGYETPKWLGRCPTCGEWNSFQQQRTAAASGGGRVGAALADRAGAKAGTAGVTRGGGSTKTGQPGPAVVSPKPLASVTVETGHRLSMGVHEFDRVLGGGMLRGSSVLLGGEPGIGKSTLMLQSARACAGSGEILYVAGEESAEQIRLRADRLGLDPEGIHILASSHLDDIVQGLIETQPVLVIVDSVQTLFAPEAASAPASPTQIKYCVYQITEWCRQNQAACLLIAHVTKDGLIAGPKLLEHMVDVVLYFEEAEAGLRVLRSYKNRYGSTDEIGLFSMGESGLSEVKDPYSVLVQEREGERPAGVAIAPIYEGSRILLVEIQALTVPARGGPSRVYSDRVDQRRVARIAAVLEKHAGLSFSDHEVYVNIAGGLKVGEVGLDLALAMALFSARSGLPLPNGSAVIGEVSLSGEVRSVPHLRRRFQAAKELGLERLVGPKTSEHDGVRRIQEAIQLLFKPAKSPKPKE